MLRTVGILLVALVAAAAMAFGFWIHQAHQAREYVSRAIPAIFTRWDDQALADRTVRELRTTEFERESHDMLYRFADILGPLQSIEAVEGSLQFGKPDPSTPRMLFGVYAARAKFARGEGSIELLVAKQDQTWRIGRFVVKSPALLPMLQEKRVRTAEAAALHAGSAEREAQVLKRATEILDLLSADDPGACWDDGAMDFKASFPRPEFVTSMHEVRRTLRSRAATLAGRRLLRTSFTEKLPYMPPGNYSTLEFESNYSRFTLRELITLQEHDGRWLLLGYDVKGF